MTAPPGGFWPTKLASPSTLRRQDEVVLARMDLHLADRDAREVSSLELRPGLSGVWRNPEPQLGPDEEKVRLDGIFLHDVRITADALLGRDDARPGSSEVGRSVDPRRQVPERVTVEGRVGRGRFEPARFDPAHPG